MHASIQPPNDSSIHSFYAFLQSFYAVLQESHTCTVQRSCLFEGPALALSWPRLTISGSRNESYVTCGHSSKTQVCTAALKLWRASCSSNIGEHTSKSSSHLCVTPPLWDHHSPGAACYSAPEGPGTCFPAPSCSCAASYTQPTSDNCNQRSLSKAGQLLKLLWSGQKYRLNCGWHPVPCGLSQPQKVSLC